MTDFNYKPLDRKILLALAREGANSSLYIPHQVTGNVAHFITVGKVLAVADDVAHVFKVGDWVEVPQAVILNQKSVMSILDDVCPEWSGLMIFWAVTNQVSGIITFPEGKEPGLLTRQEIEEAEAIKKTVNPNIKPLIQ